MSNSSMYVFTPKSVRSPLNFSCFTDCTKHASASALIHLQQEIYWIFTQRKLSSIYRDHLMGLNETSRVAYNLGETQTCNYSFLFKTYFSVAKISGEILASVWLEEESFQVLKRCYIQAYPTSFFFSVMKKLLIFFLCGI